LKILKNLELSGGLLIILKIPPKKPRTGGYDQSELRQVLELAPTPPLGITSCWVPKLIPTVITGVNNLVLIYSHGYQ
jgi:hypothetical protein